MIKITCVLLFILISISGFSQLKGLENDLNAIFEATKAPGLAVSILEGNKVFYSNPEHELLATREDKFPFKILDGLKLEFIESDSGEFDSVNLIQPNGTFKAVRKNDKQ